MDRTRFHDLVVNTGKMDANTARLALRECYETEFGIFDHDDEMLMKQHPMALVALHAKEDTFSYSLLHRYMWKFKQYDIKNTWGYNFTEFLELPWDIVQSIFRVEQKMAAQRNKEEERMSREEKEYLREKSK